MYKKRFAAFDVDGTLHDSALGTEFITELSRRGYTKHPIHQLYDNWAISGDRAAFFMQHFHPEFATLAPITQSVMEQIGRDIAAKAARSIRPAMEQRIAEHKKAGHTLFIISASPSVVIAPLAASLGFDDYESPPTPFNAQGYYAGPVHRTPEEKNKANRLALLVKKHGLSMADSWAYGDTVDDLPMLEAVTHPIAVTPTAGLRTIAIERGWEII